MHKFIRFTTTIAILLLTTQVAFAGGKIKGAIKFEGQGPKVRIINMGADPACAMGNDGDVHSETVVINDNSTLKNVMVYIEKGLEGKKFPLPSEAVVLDQKGCMYSPHVWGAMAGQEVIIKNSDRTLHNVHSLSKVNREFNMAMPKIVRKKSKIFDVAEEMFKIKCDVHPWMTTFAGIFDHPFFSVSDDSGNFNIDNLPAGTYTIRAWHERLPAQTKTITIADGEELNLDFVFTPPKRN